MNANARESKFGRKGVGLPDCWLFHGSTKRAWAWLSEKTYERALCHEFELQKMECSQQTVFPVFYKGKKVDDYIPDLIVENRVVVDTKTVDSIGDDEIGQMLNYLRITGLKVGLLINFKHSKLQWKRVVLTDH